jgi:hypothetical protein
MKPMPLIVLGPIAPIGTAHAAAARRHERGGRQQGGVAR